MKKIRTSAPANKQKGIAILPLLLMAVIIGGALVAWTATSRANTSGAQDSNNKVMGASVIDQGKSLEMVVSNYLTNGVTATALTFDTTANGGVFNPNDGVTKPSVNGNLLASSTAPDGIWVYNKVFKANGIGTAAGVDYIATVSGLKQGTCQKINEILYNSTTVPAAGVATSAFTGGATAAAPTSTSTAADLSAVAGVANWTAGCVSTTDSKYVYFHVLNAS